MTGARPVIFFAIYGVRIIGALHHPSGPHTPSSCESEHSSFVLHMRWQVLLSPSSSAMHVPPFEHSTDDEHARVVERAFVTFVTF